MTVFIQRLFTPCLVIITALALTACSTTPTADIDFKHDYDFSQVKVIGFFDRSGEVTGDNPLQLSDFQKERIDNALARELSNRGFEVTDNPDEADMLLSWHLGTHEKTDVRTYETPSYGMGMGMGYGRYGGYNRYSLYNCWGCTNTEVNVTNYTEGTFIIDMIDPKLGKSVWRSVTQSRLKGQQHEDDPEEVRAAAALVLGTFPPM